MPYVRVPDPLLDVNKPGRSTDWKQIRDNQDYFDAQITAAGLGVRTDQDIRDHFMGTAINTAAWDVTVDGTGAVAIVADHVAQLTAGTGHAILAATTMRLRIQKDEEYVAFCEARVKVTGTLAAGDTYVFGWNDNGVAALSLTDDLTDFVGMTIDTSGTDDWVATTARAAGGTSTFNVTATETNWNTLRLEFTCSATAGSRKVEVYLNDVLQTTFATDANMPTAVLRPFIGVVDSGSVLQCDYITFGFRNVPTAA